MVHAAAPAVLEAAHLTLVAPDHLVIAVAEEGRVQVDQVNALAIQMLQDLEVVAQDELVEGGHGTSIAVVGYYHRNGVQISTVRIPQYCVEK